MRHTLVAPLLLCAMGAQALPQKTLHRKIPCKTPENAAMCYWTRGRLALYNGDPAYRIWKSGTKRILGVLSGPDGQHRDPLDNEHPEFPANLERTYAADSARRVKLKDPSAGWPEAVFADFEVCPLAPERKGEMQPVCVEAAKNIFVDTNGYVPRY